MADIIDGVTVRMGGADYVVAPLTFRQLRKLQSQIDILGQVSGKLSDEQIGAVVTITHASLCRNYPEMTQDMVEDILDLGNASTVILSIMGASGLTPKTGETLGNP